MTENDELTYQNKYDLGYAKGYRIGSIESSRSRNEKRGKKSLRGIAHMSTRE